MTAAPHDPAGHRQRLRALVRVVATTTARLVLSAVRPVDRSGTVAAALLLLGLVLLVVLLVWQVRAVTRARYPVLRAVEAFVTTAVLFVVLFATGYTALSDLSPDAFSEPLDRVGAFYLTVTVLATVGFGDITPVSQAARVAVTVQMVCGLAFVGLVGRQLLAAAGRPRPEFLDADRGSGRT
jgi:FtsH-binding integral membrane protein